VIVLDASALLELLLNTPAGRAIASRLADPAVAVHVPHLIDLEIAHALRRLIESGELSEEISAAALADLRALDLQRHAHEPLLDRIWELRDHVGPADAVYLALAEVLDAELLTCDGRLPRAPGATRRVRLIAT